MTSSVIAIRLSSNLPVISDEQKLAYMTDSLMLYSYKNMLLCKIPVAKIHARIITDKNGNVINGEAINSEVTYKYFIYHQDSLYGFHYDSLNAPRGRKQLVDSFLSRKTLTNFDKAYTSLIEDCVLVDSTFQEANQTLFEKYIPKIKKDESYNDSLYLYFSSKLNAINFFSLSKEADYEKKRKLFRVRIIYNANPRSKDPFGKLAKEFTFELEQISVAGSQEVSDLFRKFQKKEG
jgi:hypothetical protein